MPIAIRSALLLWFICLLAGAAHSQDTEKELWPKAEVYVKLSEDSRLMFLGSATRIREQGYSDGTLGVHVDLFDTRFFRNLMLWSARHSDVSRSHFLQLRIGYLYSRSAKSSSSQYTEHTPTMELSPRYYLPKNILITNRLRGDLRILNGVFTPRLRERVKIERTFRFWRTALTPYGDAEIFYDWRFNAWHRFRYTGGVELEVTRRFLIDSYFVRQRDNHASTRFLNAIGLTVYVYLR